MIVISEKKRLYGMICGVNESGGVILNRFEFIRKGTVKRVSLKLHEYLLLSLKIGN